MNRFDFTISDMSDEEHRFRETITQKVTALAALVDQVIKLRSAPPEAQKMRHLALNHLTDFGLKAAAAHRLTVTLDKDRTNETLEKDRTNDS